MIRIYFTHPAISSTPCEFIKASIVRQVTKTQTMAFLSKKGLSANRHNGSAERISDYRYINKMNLYTNIQYRMTIFMVIYK
jgi:hypothetical protein